MTGPTQRAGRASDYTRPRMRAYAGLSAVTAALLVAGLLVVALSGQLPTWLTSRDAAVTEPAGSTADGGEPRPPDGPGSEPEPAGHVRPQPTEAPLHERVAALLADPSVRGSRIGLHVADESGEPVASHHADRQLLPASTAKLPVAAGALLALGPDFRYETQARATAPVRGDGVLDGSVLLVGSGDPALATPTFGAVRPDRPRTPLEAIADQIVDAGVRRVTGGVLGDPRAFTNEPFAPGWPDRYLEQDNTTRVSGLTVDAGRRLYREGGRVASEVSSDPAATAAAHLHGLLVERGVAIDGSAAGTYRPPEAPTVLARAPSPPLIELLRHTVRRSDNHFADAIFRTLGGVVADDASWEGAGTGTRRALSRLDLDHTLQTLADGSGLSRRNRLSARFLVELDVAMHRSPVASEWHRLLAVAGDSGTLRRRLRGTPAEGRLRGKTGSLTDVTALSGVVVGPDGDRFHFAVVGNRLDREGKHAVRVLQDRLGVLLAEELVASGDTPVTRRGEAAAPGPAPAARAGATSRLSSGHIAPGR